MIEKYMQYVKRVLPIAGWIAMAFGVFFLISVFVPGLIDNNDLSTTGKWVIGIILLVLGYIASKTRKARA